MTSQAREGNRVVVEAEGSATLLMDLPHWDTGDVIRARAASVFEVRDGRVVSQDSYDCYFTPRPPEPGCRSKGCPYGVDGWFRGRCRVVATRGRRVWLCWCGWTVSCRDGSDGLAARRPAMTRPLIE